MGVVVLLGLRRVQAFLLGLVETACKVQLVGGYPRQLAHHDVLSELAHEIVFALHLHEPSRGQIEVGLLFLVLELLAQSDDVASALLMIQLLAKMGSHRVSDFVIKHN